MKAGPRHLTYTHQDEENLVDPRLLRRTKALKQELEKNGALDIVSPELGKYVFALDILEKDN